MKQLIAALDAATVRAVEATSALHKAGGTAGKDLQEAVATATALRDELGIMVSAGEGIAARLADGPARSLAGHAGVATAEAPKSLEQRLDDKLRSALKSHH